MSYVNHISIKLEFFVKKHWGDPEGWYGEGGGRRGSGLGTRVHSWRIHVDVWQNQYSIVKQNKVKFLKKLYK